MSQQQKTENLRKFAEQLKAIRLRRGWNQNELAEVLGVGASSVSNWETMRNGVTRKQLHTWRRASSKPAGKPQPLPDGRPYRLFGISTIYLGCAATIATWLLPDFRTDKPVLFPFLVVGFLAIIIAELRAARSDAIQIHLRQKL